MSSWSAKLERVHLPSPPSDRAKSSTAELPSISEIAPIEAAVDADALPSDPAFRLEALRRRIARILTKASPVVKRIAADPSAGDRPFFREETAKGPLYVRTRRLVRGSSRRTRCGATDRADVGGHARAPRARSFPGAARSAKGALPRHRNDGAFGRHGHGAVLDRARVVRRRRSVAGGRAVSASRDGRRGADARAARPARARSVDVGDVQRQVVRRSALAHAVRAQPDAGVRVPAASRSGARRAPCAPSSAGSAQFGDRRIRGARVRANRRHFGRRGLLALHALPAYRRRLRARSGHRPQRVGHRRDGGVGRSLWRAARGSLSRRLGRPRAHRQTCGLARARRSDR